MNLNQIYSICDDMTPPAYSDYKKDSLSSELPNYEDFVKKNAEERDEVKQSSSGWWYFSNKKMLIFICNNSFSHLLQLNSQSESYMCSLFQLFHNFNTWKFQIKWTITKVRLKPAIVGEIKNSKVYFFIK